MKLPVSLKARETKNVVFAPDQFPQLHFVNPKLWWPYTIGTPYLYKAKIHFATGAEVSDTITVAIRRSPGHQRTDRQRSPAIQDQWAKDPDPRSGVGARTCSCGRCPKKLDADLRYVKHMGLNTIRLEGRIDRDELFNKTDEMGILVMPGWTCCDTWEQWKDVDGGDAQNRGRFHGRSGAALAQSRQRFCLAVRQRRAAARRRRENVFIGFGGCGMAQSLASLPPAKRRPRLPENPA